MIRIITATLILIFAATLANASEFSITTEIKQGNLDGLYQQLDKAKYGEVINIYIDSEGGIVDEALRIVDKMQISQAITVCKIGNMAASMAAVIMLQCDDVILSPKSIVLFHLPFYTIKSFPLFEEHVVHEGLYSEEFITMMNSRFCFRDSVTPVVYEKFLLGQDIMFEAIAAQQILDKSCRIKHGTIVVGHK